MPRITHGDAMHRDTPIPAALLNAKGDLISATAADTPAILTVGADGKVLKADSSTATGLVWADDDVGSGSVPSGTDPGDLLAWDGDSWEVLPIGNDDEVLTADAGEALGVAWAPGTGSAGRVISNTQGILEEDGFVSSGMAGGVSVVAANTGGSGLTAGQAGHPGILFLHTGTNAAGRGVAISSTLTSVLLGASSVAFGLIGKIFNGISDGTDRYTLRLGLGDVSSGEHTDGVFFRVVDNVNGGNWEAVCRSNGSETPADTGIAPDGNWHTWEFEINDDATSVEFFIDGASVATITATIPTGTGRETTFSPAGIIKSVGTNRRDFFVDAYWYHFDFATPR